MKYIRTKDNRIIEFTPKQKYENDKTTFDWFVANYCGGGINVSKVADTIEELIDEYVAKKDCSRPFVIKKYEIYSNLQFGFTIYGSIWVDDNLVKVAKMNDKGELELI